MSPAAARRRTVVLAAALVTPLGAAPAPADATARCTPGPRGRIGCAGGEMLCVDAAHQPAWRRVLERLAALPCVERIEEAFFE